MGGIRRKRLDRWILLQKVQRIGVENLDTIAGMVNRGASKESVVPPEERLLLADIDDGEALAEA